MTQEQFQALRAKICQLKEQADMALAAVAMLERNLVELVKQLHIVHNQLQGGK